MIERRNLLRVIAGAGAVGTAGCLDSASNVRESLAGGESTDPQLYERWLPASIAAADSGGIPTAYVNLGDVRDAEDSLRDSIVADVNSMASSEHRLRGLSATHDDVDAVLFTDAGRTSVMSGSFDEDAIGDDFEDADPDEVYEYEGYTVYRTEERSELPVWQMAVDSSTILQATPDGAGAGMHGETGDDADDQPAIERLIDTGEGNRDRIQDVDDDAAALMDSVDSPTYLQWMTFSDSPEGLPDGAAGTAVSWTLDDETTTARVSFLFADESSADEGEIRDTIERDGFFDRYDDVTFSTAGRIVSVEATISSEEFNFFEEPDEGEPTPRAGIQFDHGDETVVVTITSIERLDELTVRRESEVLEVLEDPSVGDSVEIDVSSGGTITVVGSVENGETAVLGTYDV